MKLSEIIRMQQDFDSMHKGKFMWNQKVTEENLEILSFLMVAMTGELGETANIIKKVIRGDCSLESRRKDIEEEITDLFIYIIKFAYQMDIDIESKFVEKLEYNKERFSKYAIGQKKELK